MGLVARPAVRWAACGLLALLVAAQLAVVFRAALLVPFDAEGFVRLDCVASRKGGKEAGSVRDCLEGQGRYCTRSEPCTPCESSGGGSCRTCAAGEQAECSALPEVGPYCRFEVDENEADAETVNLGATDWRSGKRVQVKLCNYCCVPEGGF